MKLINRFQKVNDFEMTMDQLRQLIEEVTKQHCETQCIELKKAKEGTPKSLFGTLSSFSNQPGGGIILFGIDEENGYAITGVYDAQDLQSKVSEQALQMEPQVRPVFTTGEIDNNIVVAAEISECETHLKPCFYKGKGRLKGSYVRVGERDEPMTEYEVYSYEAFKRKLQDELTAVSRADLEDLDSDLLQSYFMRLRQEKPNLSRESDEKILTLLGFTDKQTGHPTIAGLMLFGNYPQAFYPQLCVTAMVVDGTEFGALGAGGERFVDNKRIEGTIQQMLRETLAFVRRNTRVATVIIDGQRADRTEYPINAVREAVLNALIHRDYSFHTDSSPIQVIIFSDRLEIENPGGLYGRLTIDRLGHAKADTRNPCIAGAVEILGDTENRYSGIPTMRRELAAVGLPEPIFENERGAFKITFRKHGWNSIDAKIQRLLGFCSTPRSREEIADFLEINSVYHAIKKYVKPLLEDGRIAITLPDKPQSSHQRYFTREFHNKLSNEFQSF